MEKLHESVRIHEEAEEDSGERYKSHMGERFEQISEDPINPWAKDKVKYQNTDDSTQQGVAQKFINQIQKKLAAKRDAVIAQFKPRPTRKYFDPDPHRRLERIPAPNYEY